MKFIVNSKKAAGNALLVCLMATAVVGFILTAYLTLLKAQNQSVARSQTWNTTVSIIEAGMEEAISHLNTHGTTNLLCDGWRLSGTKYVMKRPVGEGFYIVSIDSWVAGTNTNPVIESRAFITPPVLVASADGLVPFVAAINGGLTDNAFSPEGKLGRGVRAQVGRDSLFSKGLVAKGKIDLNGNNITTDSYDSSNPAYNTDGHYDPTKRKANGDIATDAVVTNSISIGNADIYGKVSTGPQGTVSVGANGSVGDAAWHAGGSHGIQPGYSTDDMNVAFPNATVPFTTGFTGPDNSTNGVAIFNGGNYILSSLSLSGKNKIMINGDVSIWVPSGFSMSGQSEIDIATTGKLTIYTGAGSTVGGNGILNASLDATRCSIIGLPTCTSLSFGGNAGFTGTIYAPSADFSMSGGGSTSYDFAGAAITKSVTMNGHFTFHYDEALRTKGPARGYIITSWNEMNPADVRNIPPVTTF